MKLTKELDLILRNLAKEALKGETTYKGEYQDTIKEYRSQVKENNYSRMMVFAKHYHPNLFVKICNEMRRLKYETSKNLLR